MATERIDFPERFHWGVATSAYQIEGYPLADGAAPSIWHEFSHRRGRVRDGTNGDVACDHYHRYLEDVRSMRELGLSAYRFSVAWPRVFPEPGRVNSKGLDFYSRLVDALLEAGIEPFVTLFHWDTPLWLEKRGGMASRSCLPHFLEYGGAVFRTLGDRVKSWITINEPVAYAYSGYLLGENAPGHRLDLSGAFRASHHLLLAHARLRDACHAAFRDARAGIVNHNVWVTPRDPGAPRDVEAAELMDQAANGIYLDPLFKGSYPERVLRRLGGFLPRGFERDLEEMHGREDFVGVNYYNRNRYRWAPLVPFVHAREWMALDAPRSAMWEIYPRGIGLMLDRLRTEYGNPAVFVTENGFPLPEVPGAEPLDDRPRISYLEDHIAEMGRAIRRGSDCRGYFHWTLMDNFEWELGNEMRFGLLRTDFATQRREWKRSAYWFQKLARANRLVLERAGGSTDERSTHA